MRRIVVCLVVAALSVAMPAVVAADPSSTCPDQKYPIPMSSLLVPNGEVKDKNHNGIVCVKYTDGGFKGGPDDRTVSDDILL
jgi:hypothetical protein